MKIVLKKLCMASCCRRELILKYCDSEGLDVAEIVGKIADALESDNIRRKRQAQKLRKEFLTKNIVSSVSTLSSEINMGTLLSIAATSILLYGQSQERINYNYTGVFVLPL